MPVKINSYPSSPWIGSLWLDRRVHLKVRTGILKLVAHMQMDAAIKSRQAVESDRVGSSGENIIKRKEYILHTQESSPCGSTAGSTA